MEPRILAGERERARGIKIHKSGRKTTGQGKQGSFGKANIKEEREGKHSHHIHTQDPKEKIF